MEGFVIFYCVVGFQSKISIVPMFLDGDKSDEDAAVLEEQEALVIQQRMAQQLAEDDFGLEFLTHLKV